MRVRLLSFIGGAALVLVLLAVPNPAAADHAWWSYHWPRAQNPFTVTLGDNVSSNWDFYLATASSDWSRSSVLDARVVAGSSTSSCRTATSGRVEVCNRAYGNGGWLGIARIWLSGSHITQGTAMLNDTYFNTPAYDTQAWRQLVMCQEIGHTLGLDHQDDDPSNPNLGTCMDYTNSPDSGQHPNSHDYQQLETIYAHRDSGPDGPSGWGRVATRSGDGITSTYVQELANDKKVVTLVVWAR